MSWDELRSSVKGCSKCEMAKTRKNVVIGRGSSQPLVVFVGEAPGQDEDKKGLPFVGRAGQVLDAEIKRIGLSYNEYYIMNACKCRPITKDFKNRKPTEPEMNNCKPFFVAQLRLLRPHIAVLLGQSAKDAFYASSADTIPVCLSFIHPAFTLYKPKMYLVFREQFNKLQRIVEGLRGERKNKENSLF